MNPDDIAHVDSEGWDEEKTRACSYFHQRPIEVHGPKLGLELNRRMSMFARRKSTSTVFYLGSRVALMLNVFPFG
jgi:hypothetical protein